MSPTPMDISMKEEDLCQAFSDVLLSNVEDIDADDWENPQLCSDYVKDIYLYLRQLEVWMLTFSLTTANAFKLKHSVNHMGISLNSCSSQYIHAILTGRRSMGACVQS